MAESKPIRAIVVDDEPLGRRRIEDALRTHPDVVVVASVGDGQSAVEAIRSHGPDLVFLDVQMPRMTGLDVMRTVGEGMPLTIFVTAYDKHAVSAFDLAAIDYLIKPFDDDRFDGALERARRQIGLRSAADIRERLLAVLEGDPKPAVAVASAPHPASQPTAEAQFIERIAVESRGEVRFVPVSEIEAIVASGPYAEIVTGDRRHLIRETMNALEEGLDPARFLRIHRSSIVAVDSVDALLRGAGGDYEVRIRNGARLAVARSRRAVVEERLGMRR